MAKTAAALEDDRISKEVSNRQVRYAIGATYLGYLRVILPSLAAFFFILTAFHLRFSPPPVNSDLALLSGIIGITCVGFYIMLRMGLIRAYLSHYIVAPIAVMSLALIFTNVFLNGDLTQLNKALFVMMSIAVFILSRTVFWPLMALVGVLYIAALSMIDGEVAHHALMGLGTGILSCVFFIARTRLLRAQLRLSIAVSARDKELQDNIMHRDRFLGAMSYELRTPLTGVLGMLDLLKAAKLGREERKYVEVADKSAELLRAIINDMLDMARLKAGEMPLVNQVFRPDQVADGVIRLLSNEAAEKGISISFAADGDIPDAVMGDLGKISQVLMNLVANAVKSTDLGGIDIYLSGVRTGEMVNFTWKVKDTGAGIAAEDLGAVFKGLEQKNANIERDSIGLGLEISSHLVALMDGDIEVASTLGEGSSFWFTIALPVAEATELIEEDEVALPIFDLPLNILLAEDNPINQMLIVKLLEAGPKWSISLVPNGREAVAAVADNDFDLVLMDIQMPVMDGLEATRQIRALPDGGKDVPIVALTANALAEDVAEYHSMGMANFIAKPINSELFYKAIARAAKTSQQSSK